MQTQFASVPLLYDPSSSSSSLHIHSHPQNLRPCACTCHVFSRPGFPEARPSPGWPVTSSKNSYRPTSPQPLRCRPFGRHNAETTEFRGVGLTSTGQNNREVFSREFSYREHQHHPRRKRALKTACIGCPSSSSLHICPTIRK